MQRKCKQNAKLSSPGASDVAQCGKITVDPGSVTTTTWDKLGCGSSLPRLRQRVKELEDWQICAIL